MTIKLRASSACPSCSTRHVVDIEEALRALPTGSYSIAGAQTKVVAREVWQYRCTNCSATGQADAPQIDRETLASFPVCGCGHIAGTGHYGGSDHNASVCPGCCPACQTSKDAARASR